MGLICIKREKHREKHLELEINRLPVESRRKIIEYQSSVLLFFYDYIISWENELIPHSAPELHSLHRCNLQS